MGKIVPFSVVQERIKAQSARARSGAKGAGQTGAVILFTGVRYERIIDEPDSPAPKSKHASGIERRKRR